MRIQWNFFWSITTLWQMILTLISRWIPPITPLKNTFLNYRRNYSRQVFYHRSIISPRNKEGTPRRLCFALGRLGDVKPGSKSTARTMFWNERSNAHIWHQDIIHALLLEIWPRLYIPYCSSIFKLLLILKKNIFPRHKLLFQWIPITKRNKPTILEFGARFLWTFDFFCGLRMTGLGLDTCPQFILTTWVTFLK